MSDERIQRFLFERADDLRTPGFAVPRTVPALSNDVARALYHNVPNTEGGSRLTESSSSTEHSYSLSSQTDSSSTAPSSAPSATGPPLVLLNPIQASPLSQAGDILRCDLVFTSCAARYHPDREHDYISHSISHFPGFGPPAKSVCIFCDDVVFENASNPVEAWRRRMRHISAHLRAGLPFDNARIDYFVIDHLREMVKERALDARVLANWEGYTERTGAQQCPDMLPAGTKPDELKWKEERMSRQADDLEKERREMRKLKKARAARQSRV